MNSILLCCHNHFYISYTQIGLLLDLIGVFLLLKYGLPTQYREEGGILTGESPEEEEIRSRHNKKVKRFAHFALWLIVLGFIFQLIGSYSNFHIFNFN